MGAARGGRGGRRRVDVRRRGCSWSETQIGEGDGGTVAESTNLDSCPTARPTLYDVTIGNTNVADVASDGHVWALDDYTQHVQVWKIGQKQYCFRIEYEGIWTSFAGVSPGGTGTISEGITGTFYGMRILRLTGEFSPSIRSAATSQTSTGSARQTAPAPGRGHRPACTSRPSPTSTALGMEFHATSATNGTWRRYEVRLFRRHHVEEEVEGLPIRTASLLGSRGRISPEMQHLKELNDWVTRMPSMWPRSADIRRRAIPAEFVINLVVRR